MLLVKRSRGGGCGCERGVKSGVSRRVCRCECGFREMKEGWMKGRNERKWKDVVEVEERCSF